MSKNSTTTRDEYSRMNKQKVDRSYFSSSIGLKYGRIKEVHEELYEAVITLEEGGLAFAGDFIRITNSALNLIRDFGALRKGMLVKLTYKGDQESFPEAEVIGPPEESIGTLQEKPDIDLGLYEIFSPDPAAGAR